MPLALWPFPTAMLADGVAVVVGGKAFRAGRCGWSEGSGACGLWVGSAWKTWLRLTSTRKYHLHIRGGVCRSSAGNTWKAFKFLIAIRFSSRSKPKRKKKTWKKAKPAWVVPLILSTRIFPSFIFWFLASVVRYIFFVQIKFNFNVSGLNRMNISFTQPFRLPQFHLKLKATLFHINSNFICVFCL